MPLMFRHGKLLFRNGLLAMHPRCCCVGCCCLDPYSELLAEFSGAIEGTGTLVPALPEGACAAFEGHITIDDTCGGEFNVVFVRLVCPFPTTSAGALRLLVSGDGAGCSLTGGEIVPDPNWTCDPLFAQFRLETVELFPDGCPCGDGEEVTVTITAP